jgi:hypothetical protein
LKLLTGTAAIPGLRGKNANKKMLHPKPTQPPTLLWLIYGGIYNNKKKPFRAEDIFTQLLVVTAASKKIKRRVAFSSFFQPAKKVVVIHIMLSNLLTQKFLQKKRLLILDTLEHVDSEKLNRHIDSTNFFQNVIFTS